MSVKSDDNETIDMMEIDDLEDNSLLKQYLLQKEQIKKLEDDFQKLREVYEDVVKERDDLLFQLEDIQILYNDLIGPSE